MKKILSIFIIMLFSCNSKNNKQENSIEASANDNGEMVYEVPKITGGKYFEYDELIHYNSKIDEDQIVELHDNKSKSELDSLKMGVILNETPKSINDTTFIKKLEKLGYSKAKIDRKKFDKINEIFTEKKHSEFYATACVYIYRDILIFKRKSKIIGIAKICFGCDANLIHGTNANTEEFGMSGDYEKLREILYQK